MPLVGCLLLGLVAGGAAYAIHQYVESSSYFVVDRIEVHGDVPQEWKMALTRLPIKTPARIFDVDLVGLSEWLSRAHPEFQDMTVVRRLPHTLVIEVKTREPKARLAYGDQRLCMDAAGMIFPDVVHPRYRHLPLIIGLDPRLVSLTIGETTRALPVQRAIALLEALQASGLLNRFKLEHIDASDYKNLSIRFAGWPDLNVGYEAFDERLGRFELLLPVVEPRKTQIEYLDVRFADPIIKPKP